MSVVGFDLGNLQSVISVARNRGIDVICNEVSNRATPSLVSFGFKQRFLGEAAKTQEVSNFKNTVSNMKRLAGRTVGDPEIQEVEAKLTPVELVDVDGQVGVKVNYLGEQHTFSNIQVIAMYLAKLRDITANEIQNAVSDCVITVPGWFTDVQRRAVLAASQIAGLNCLRLVNDLTAAALGYGITKLDLPEEKPRNVVFVDIGHSDYSVQVVSFIKGQLTVRSAAYDIHFGGRDFDQVIMEHLAVEFKEKYKIDVWSNKKAILRLRVAAEKCKRVLSANPQAAVNIESIMEDRDVSTIVNRTDFEEWAQHLFGRTADTLQKALAKAGMSADDIDAVELVGGTTRIPAIKATVKQILGKEISTTLNQDEAISRGAALQCAIISPVFKVRDFRVNDICSYPIKLSWDPTPEEDDTEIVVFDRNNAIPSTKILTFTRSEPFTLYASYVHPEEIPRGINPWIGQFTIKNVEPANSSGEPSEIKVKVRLNIHGILSVESAYTVEEKEHVEEITNKDGEKETKKTKKLVKKADLPVVSGTTALSKHLLDKYTEQESQMSSSDKLIAATEAAKNSLEEYGYEMRDKVEGPYAAYIDPGVKDQFLKDLNAVVDWIYDEGDDQPKSVYVEKLNALRKIGDPVMERYREAEERPSAERALRNTIERLTQEAMSQDEKYSHIPPQEKQDIVDRAERARRWLDDQLAKQANVPKYDTPVLLSRDIAQEENAVIAFATPILNKPKPAPKPETDTQMTEDDEGNKEESQGEKGNEMDID